MSNRSYRDYLRDELAGMRKTFNSPWECRIGLTSTSFHVELPARILTFNSPWECRIGLTIDSVMFKNGELVLFQFPVGMSNRSYWTDEKIGSLPLGAFNSPWECRIGLTTDKMQFDGSNNITFNSPWECRIGLTNKIGDYYQLIHIPAFQFPVGMSNRSYRQVCINSY